MNPSPAAAPWLYLASQSPRRRQLLEQLGVGCRLLLPDDPQLAEALEQPIGGQSAPAYVQRVTLLKLQAAQARHAAHGLPPGLILCSDTTVALGRRLLGKPTDPEDAARLLSALSGRTHGVLTAVAVARGRRRRLALSISRVRFAVLSPRQIRAYVATGEPMGKAGAYGIQGLAAAHIAQISGSYSGIMGLPLFETAQLLREFGYRV